MRSRKIVVLLHPKKLGRNEFVCTSGFWMCRVTKSQRNENNLQKLIRTTTNTPRTRDLLELPSLQWATKHHLARCQIAAGPTPTTHYQPDQQTFGGSGMAVGSAGIPGAYYGLFTIFPPPQNNVFMTLLQRNQYLLPKTNSKNQSTRATTTA